MSLNRVSLWFVFVMLWHTSIEAAEWDSENYFGNAVAMVGADYWQISAPTQSESGLPTVQ